MVFSACLFVCLWLLAYREVWRVISGMGTFQNILEDIWYNKMENNLLWKPTFDGSPPLIEDDLWWKTTFNGRWSLMETFDGRHGRRPLMEYNPWWKTIFDGIQYFMEDKLWWEMTFDGRQPFLAVITYIWWKINFDGRRSWRQPLKEDYLYRDFKSQEK